MKGLLGAGATSVALALSFPHVALWPLAWIALVPLLVASIREPRSTPRLFGVAGMLFHALNLPWIRQVMIDYGGLPAPLATGVFMLLVAYLMCFWLLLGWMLRALLSRWGSVGMMGLPIAWVAVDQWRNFPFGGFPWCLLGYSQVGADWISQSAAITGVHGLTFLLVMVQSTVALWFAPGERAPARSARRAASVASAFLVVACLGYGGWILSHGLGPTTLRVGAVQGNVPQGQKWDPDFAVRIFTEHMRLSEEAVRAGASLVVWPESSTPFYFDGTPALAEPMRSFARQKGIDLLFGGDDRERSEEEVLIAYNGAKLIDSKGEVSFRYHKMHLVPFGEYVPLPDWLGLGAMVQAVGDFRPGKDANVGKASGVSFGVSICYEVIKAELSREFVRRGAELLLNITNDAWFGESSAPHQHFAMARMRAIETRRYLVRAANTGITAFVDPYGRVLQRSQLFQQTVMVSDVAARSDLTPYVRLGNVLGRLCVVLTCAFLLVLAVGSLRRRVTERYETPVDDPRNGR